MPRRLGRWCFSRNRSAKACERRVGAESRPPRPSATHRTRSTTPRGACRFKAQLRATAASGCPPTWEEVVVAAVVGGVVAPPTEGQGSQQALWWPRWDFQTCALPAATRSRASHRRQATTVRCGRGSDPVGHLRCVLRKHGASSIFMFVFLAGRNGTSPSDEARRTERLRRMRRKKRIWFSADKLLQDEVGGKAGRHGLCCECRFFFRQVSALRTPFRI